MIICSKCKTSNPDNALFCASCGNGLVEKCIRCNTVVTKDMKFCINCSMPLDGSTLCPTCKAVVSPDQAFCANCGVGKNGERLCRQCGATIAKGVAYCGQCGSAVNTQTVAVKNSAGTGGVIGSAVYSGMKKATGSTKVVNALKSNTATLIKTWVLTGILLLLFIFSFLPVFKMESKALGMELKCTVNSVQIISASFTMMNAPEQAEVQAEFLDFAAEHGNIDKDMSEKDIANEQLRLMNKFGILRLMTTKETISVSPSIVIQIALWTIVVLGLMISLLTFLILAVIKSIKFTIDSQLQSFGSGTLAISLAFGLTFILGILMGGYAVGSLLIMCFAAVTLASMGVFNYISNADKLTVKQFVTKGISATLAIVLSVLIVGTGLSMRLTVEGSKYKVKDEVFEVISSIDLIKADDENSMFFGNEKQKLLEAFPSLIQEIKLMKESGLSKKTINKYLAATFSGSQIYSFSETESNKPIGIITSVFGLLGMICVSAGLGGVLMFSFGDVAEGKKGKKRMLWFILTLCGTAVLLVCNIVNLAAFNSIFSQLNIKSAKFSIGAPLIAAMIIAVGMIVTQGLLSSKAKPTPRNNFCQPTVQPMIVQQTIQPQQSVTVILPTDTEPKTEKKEIINNDTMVE